MKYKIIDGTTMNFAGVASYDTLSDQKKTKKNKSINFNFDIPQTPNIDIDSIKKEAHRIKEEAKKIKFDFKHNKDTASDSDDSENYKKHSYDFHFETPESEFLQGFSSTMKEFGKNMERWGKSFEKNMETWSKNFNNEMDNHWNNDYSSDSYDIWELESLFNELYSNSDQVKESDQSPKLFYEVKGFDLNTTMNDQLTFIGCQVSDQTSITYPFVSQQLTAEKWLVLKLTDEEFTLDWMKKLDSIPELDDYDHESYFILRHFKNKEKEIEKPLKLYIALTRR